MPSIRKQNIEIPLDLELGGRMVQKSMAHETAIKYIKTMMDPQEAAKVPQAAIDHMRICGECEVLLERERRITNLTWAHVPIVIPS